MKLKQIPEDFRVDEVTDIAPSTEGPFVLYRLEKKNWTTPDALQVIRQRWKVPSQRLSFGGLKDRHAHTIQYFTILNGPERQLNQPGIAVTPLGRAVQPFQSSDIRVNRFTLTLRSMSAKAIEAGRSSVADLERSGVPNYFDEQRFGSVGYDGRFVAKEMVLGRYDQALKTALSAPYEHDRAAMKQEKALLREAWGDWPRLKEQLPRGQARNIINYLAHHPDDFRGAIERIKPELRSLYLAAWQSQLWNQMLGRWMIDTFSHSRLMGMRFRMGDLPVPKNVPADKLEMWRTLMLPLPSARIKIDPAAPWAKSLEAVMEQEEVRLDQVKLKDFRKPFFSKGDRPAAVIPQGLNVREERDDLNSGKWKWVLRFDLPRGCYATMIVKRLTQMRDD